MGKQRFTTSIEFETLKRLKHRAIEENTSVSELLERITTAYLDANAPKEPQQPPAENPAP